MRYGSRNPTLPRVYQCPRNVLGRKSQPVHRRRIDRLSISTPQLGSRATTTQGAWPCPRVIVLLDPFSLSGVTHGQTDWLAKEGYLAVALDLFSWRAESAASVP